MHLLQRETVPPVFLGDVEAKHFLRFEIDSEDDVAANYVVAPFVLIELVAVGDEAAGGPSCAADADMELANFGIRH